MIYTMLFVIWYAMKKSYINDKRIEAGKKPRELQLYRIEEVKKFGVRSFWVDNFNDYLLNI